jgi:hypothetical protein
MKAWAIEPRSVASFRGVCIWSRAGQRDGRQVTLATVRRMVRWGWQALARATLSSIADVGAPAPLGTLPVDPVGSVEDAIARMQEIGGTLPPTDGLACFNRMYLIVTEAVRRRVTSGFFADPAFMARLDVNFANRYLAAIRAYRMASASAPRAWRLLLDSRADPGVAPMQFAIAGTNAHINYDLAPALVQTCLDCDTAPDQGVHHADFEKVNQLLAALDPQVRESFEQDVLLDLDRRFGGLDNLVDMFSITAAREAAWVHGEVLWRLRSEELLAASYLTTLDRTVAFAGRALLVRLPRL